MKKNVYESGSCGFLFHLHDRAREINGDWFCDTPMLSPSSQAGLCCTFMQKMSVFLNVAILVTWVKMIYHDLSRYTVTLWVLWHKIFLPSTPHLSTHYIPWEYQNNVRAAQDFWSVFCRYPTPHTCATIFEVAVYNNLSEQKMWKN